ncbi:angiopoietin-related protein 3 [Protopterus annectens]|uniref:angiopoietin-related protein 3 n=1 Tax=Protopterus annectens TaxID=7888 RepID=UPI001CFAEDEB|nr:angiopoietin-related protein 3 [Protopterus annectens]
MKAIVIVLIFLFCSTTPAKIEKESSPTHKVPEEPRSRFAMLDDVRILANGLLQLGHGLKDFVHKTKTQINDIFSKLSIFDKSYYELSAQTNEIKAEEEQLKMTTTKLQATNEQLKNMSLDMNAKINYVLHDKSRLQIKIDGLEEQLTQITQSQAKETEKTEVSALKELIGNQDKNIKELIKTVAEQHEQLDQQKNQIKDLEEKMNHGGFQDNNENMYVPKQMEAKVIRYLSRNATGVHLDCSDIYDEGERVSGIYTINPNGSKSFNVFCDMKTDGGWTVIQQRINGTLDFDQSWGSYEKGFGDLEAEFWLGLENIYAIIQHGDYILHTEVEDWKGMKRFIEYAFSMGNQESGYNVSLTPVLLEGVPNIITQQSGIPFNTKDHSTDRKRNASCTENYSGGWWYYECGEASLNGKYVKPKAEGKAERRKGIHWKPGKGRYYTLKATKMMIRPAEFEHLS